MCGIAGIFDNRGVIDVVQSLTKALERMEPRGPDERGIRSEANWAIGMQRLSIVDHENGSQPQGNKDCSVLVIHNGEIYNHVGLTKHLTQKGYNFSTLSDTEVLVHGYEEWGIEGILSRIEGMYAFAILDIKSQRLHLARDRFGEKPLYYHTQSGLFAFASDLKALINAIGLQTEIDPLSLRRYLALHYVPGNRSIWRGLERILPGERVEINLSDLTIKKHSYYKIPIHDEFPFVPGKLDNLLQQAVSSRLMGEVPVGVFLSGGLDSSIVTALASKCTSKLKTFSIGFNSPDHDESKHACTVASACGVSHQLINFTEQDFRELLPIVASQLDEPLGDPALLPTSKLCREAKNSVKVILSGEGADELFAGYDYYLPLGKKQSWLQRLLRNDSPTPSSNLLDPHSLTTPSGFPLVCGKTEWESLSLLIPDEEPDLWEAEYLATINSVKDPLRKASLGDIFTWLPDNLLVKLDRMTMSHSLEGRSPFLMQSLVEYAISLPARKKIKNDQVKKPLRNVARQWIPNNVSKRKKQGFVLPMADWLSNYVYEFGGAAEYVRQCKCSALDEDRLTRFLHERLRAPRGNERILYSLIMFLEWFKTAKVTLSADVKITK
jgi:asparagine synthase (glutamine-hydrolysing)